MKRWDDLLIDAKYYRALTILPTSCGVSFVGFLLLSSCRFTMEFNHLLSEIVARFALYDWP